MANYDNIKQYADFAHDAAKVGGVKNYLDEYGDAKFELGIASEKETEGWKAVLLAGITVALWEGGKTVIHKIKKINRTKKENTLNRANKAREEYIASINKCEPDD